MTRSLDDPQFVGRVPAVARPLTYFVEFAGQRSPTYRITVFEYPELVRADADLKYPEYTRLEPKTVEDVRQVTAVEGTQLTLKFRLNKDVADARLVDRDGEEIVLKRAEGADPVYEVSYALERSQRFKLHLTDDAGSQEQAAAGVRGQRDAEQSADDQARQAGTRRARVAGRGAAGGGELSRRFRRRRLRTELLAGRRRAAGRVAGEALTPQAAMRRRDKKRGKKLARASRSTSSRSRPSPISSCPTTCGPRTSAPTASRGAR